MLPGVELARRRRVHHGHEVRSRDPHDPAAAGRVPSALTAMDESAVNARRRLEERLRCFSTPPSSPSPMAGISNLIRSKANSRVCPDLEIASMVDAHVSQSSKENEIKK